jgi:hypothetical protein
MITREQWRTFIDSPVVEWSLFGLGVVLLLLAPVVGVLPGPGGVIVAGIGLSLVLKTSLWAKRHYVRFKRWQPKAGGWTDWALRRRSARRRLKRQKLRKEQGLAPRPAIEEGPIESLVPDPPLTPPETWADREGRANRDRTAN